MTETPENVFEGQYTEHKVDPGDDPSGHSEGGTVSVHPLHPEASAPPVLNIFRPSDLKLDLTCTNYLLKGLIDAGDLGVVYGPPGAGKSFCAKTLSRHITAGLPFVDRRTRKCGALYVTLEGESGFKKRLVGLEQEDGFEPDDQFLAACQRGSDFKDPRFLQSVIDTMKSENIELVIIDTLARFLGDSDENTNAGMSRAIDFADTIKSATGAACLFIHHSGKDTKQGARGHSSLRGAVDLEISVTRPDDGTRIMKFVKVKDGEDGQEYSFDLTVKELGNDDEGEPVTTCIAENFRLKTNVRLINNTAIKGVNKQLYEIVVDYFAEGGGILKNPNGDGFQTRVGTTRDLYSVSEAKGFIEPAPVSLVGGVSEPDLETDTLEKSRVRRNQARIAKALGQLRTLGLIGYKNPEFWLPERAEK